MADCNQQKPDGRWEILADTSNNSNDDINNEIDVSKMWEAISETIKSAAKERVREKKQQKKTNFGLMKNALNFMRNENKQGIDG